MTRAWSVLILSEDLQIDDGLVGCGLVPGAGSVGWDFLEVPPGKTRKGLFRASRISPGPRRRLRMKLTFLLKVVIAFAVTIAVTLRIRKD